jgi:hypothetical protein
MIVLGSTGFLLTALDPVRKQASGEHAVFFCGARTQMRKICAFLIEPDGDLVRRGLTASYSVEAMRGQDGPRIRPMESWLPAAMASTAVEGSV